mmetsp:Transcript_22223/g.15850  ORF Transcript_22223/g.15850 Transcript_22223/m.15850 type:complete len:109 (-) Transcript_22223:192-518(-)
MENNRNMDTAVTAAMNSFGLEGNFKASQMPIKNRINAIDRGTKECLKQLNENKKDMHLLRNECATLEHHCTETTNDILKEIIEDIVNLEKDLHKIQSADANEVLFLKQ